MRRTCKENVPLQALERKNIDKTPLKEAKLPVIWVLGEFASHESEDIVLPHDLHEGRTYCT